MKVVLLKNVLQNGQVKTTVRTNKRQVIGWFAGTEMEVAESTGHKLIASGDAREVRPPVPISIEEEPAAAESPPGEEK